MGEGSGPNSVHDAFVSEDSDVCWLLRSRNREALVFNKCGSVYVSPITGIGHGQPFTLSHHPVGASCEHAVMTSIQRYGLFRIQGGETKAMMGGTLVRAYPSARWIAVAKFWTHVDHGGTRTMDASGQPHPVLARFDHRRGSVRESLVEVHQQGASAASALGFDEALFCGRTSRSSYPCGPQCEYMGRVRRE